jgi:hypothetical protein
LLLSNEIQLKPIRFIHHVSQWFSIGEGTAIILDDLKPALVQMGTITGHMRGQ